MFKIVKPDSYKWPVSVKLPIDGGKFETSVFDVQFKRLSRQEVDALRDDLFKEKIDPAAFCRTLVVGWSGVEDADGPVPFSADALERVLDIQGVAAAIVTEYFESLMGAARKN